jgi:hypothetical protein
MNVNAIETGEGNDIITSTAVIYNKEGGIDNAHKAISNDGTINTGNGQDSIISVGNFTNRGGVFLGDGNDSITASMFTSTSVMIGEIDLLNRALENFNAIETGDGNDTITSTGVIYNEGVIETGNGDDSIIVDGGVNGTGTIRKIIVRHSEKAGIDKQMSPHRIRHSAITAALDATDGNVRKVQKLSRHKNLNTLMIYDDNRGRDQQDVTD